MRRDRSDRRTIAPVGRAVSSRRTTSAGHPRARRRAAVRLGGSGDRADVVLQELNVARSRRARQCDAALRLVADADWISAQLQFQRVALRSVDRPVQREAAGEIGELLAQNQPPAMQTRFQRLILHAQHRARFFRRHALDVAQHHRRAIDRRQREHGAEDPPPQLRRAARARRPCRDQSAIVGRRRPPSRSPSLVIVDVVLVLRPLIFRGPQPRHRRVERDPVDPRRQRRVAAERSPPCGTPCTARPGSLLPHLPCCGDNGRPAGKSWSRRRRPARQSAVRRRLAADEKSSVFGWFPHDVPRFADRKHRGSRNIPRVNYFGKSQP